MTLIHNKQNKMVIYKVLINQKQIKGQKKQDQWEKGSCVDANEIGLQVRLKEKKKDSALGCPPLELRQDLKVGYHKCLKKETLNAKLFLLKSNGRLATNYNDQICGF